MRPVTCLPPPPSAAQGDVSKAINLFYDLARPQAGRAAESSAASGSTAARAAGLGSPHSSQHKADSRKRPAAASPPASQGSKRSKGTPAASIGAARGGQGKGGTGGKSRGGKGMAGKPAVGGKGSAKVAGQASIKSFFGVPAGLGSGTPAGGQKQQGTACKGNSGVRTADGSKTAGERGSGGRGGGGSVAVVDLVSDDDEHLQTEVVEEGEQQVEARASLDVPQELQEGKVGKALLGGAAAVDFSALLFHTLGKGTREGTGAARGAGAVTGAGEETGGASIAGAAGRSGRWVGQWPSKASAPAAARGGTQSPPPAAALLPTSAPALATGLPHLPTVSLPSGLDADVDLEVAGGDGVPVVDHVDGQLDHQQQQQQQQRLQQEGQQQEHLQQDASSLARAATQDALLSPVRPARSLAMPPAVLTPPTPRSLAMPSALSIPRSLGMPGAPSPAAKPSTMAPATGMVTTAAGTPCAQALPDRSALAACRQPAPGLATSAPQLQEAGKQAAPAITSDLVKGGPDGVAARDEVFGGDPARQQRAQQQGHGGQVSSSSTGAQEAEGAAGAFLIGGVTEPQAGSERDAEQEKDEDEGAAQEEVLGSQQQASAQPTSPSLSPSAPLWTSRVQSQGQGRGQARGKGRGQGKGKATSVAAHGKVGATRGTKAGNAGGLQRAGASAAAQPSSAFFSNKKLGQQQEVDVVAAAGASHSQGDEQLGQAGDDSGDADAVMTDGAARGTTAVAGAAQHQDGVSGLATARGGPGAPLPFAVPTPPTATTGKATGPAAAGESSARGASKPHAAPATAASAQQLQQWREALLLPVQQYEPVRMIGGEG